MIDATGRPAPRGRRRNRCGTRVVDAGPDGRLADRAGRP
ncbi:hypothetical protein CZ771_11765 [Actinomycetales bacterium JB111]|nr:hypothetical protein CZ771_11765 [Actinomycetales bacterium JB111]